MLTVRVVGETPKVFQRNAAAPRNWLRTGAAHEEDNPSKIRRVSE